MTEVKNKPTKKAQEGSISIAEFPNGSYGKSYVVQKSWKDKKTGEWKRSSINLFENELPKLKKVLEEINK